MSPARVLRLLGDRVHQTETDGTLVVAPTGSPTVRVEPSLLHSMAAEGLITTSDGVRRTAAGRACLRRALAETPQDVFTAQHRELVVEDRGPDADVVVNAAECPLTWLATRRDKDGSPMLSAEQLQAGRRLARDHERGHQRERVTQSWAGSGVKGEARRDRLSVSEAANDARRRVERALDAVGPGLASVLVAVCCEEVGLSVVERKHGWPARSGKVVLRLALDRLVAHYGLGPYAQGASRSALVRWGAADYRPHA
ncbi:DUF6456 domain-containing protein [Acuticoccus sp.]|uniref:DUF6456 domain-containing protein n=1 Tax=Acuticoccus sp. TaxID=1904378 RepID=UPI003B51C96E